MNKRGISYLLVFVLIFSMFANVFSMQAGQASGPATIQADKQTEAQLNNPELNEDGSIAFFYQGKEKTNHVRVAGAFTDWEKNAIEMKKTDHQTWEATTTISPGIYAYKLIVDGEWILDPHNDEIIQGEYGDDSKLIVPGLTLSNSSEIEKGTEIILDAGLIDEQGEKTSVDPKWSLKNTIEGVQIEGQTLTLDNSVAKETEFTIIGHYEDFTIEKTFKVEESLYEYTINYFRYDGMQEKYDMWIWEDNKDGKEYEFTDKKDNFVQGTHKFNTNKINVITRPGDWSSQEATRTIQMPEGKTKVEVWIIEGVKEVYYNKDDFDLSARIQAAFMDSENRITLTTTHLIEENDLSTFSLTDQTNNQKIKTEAKVTKSNQVQLTVLEPDKIDVRNLYEVRSEQFSPSNVTMRKVLDNKKYFYEADDLGLTYSPEKSSFKIWAPTAVNVHVSLYDEAGTYINSGTVEDHTGGRETAMKRADNGVWSQDLNGDHQGKYYMFKLEFADGTTNYAVDPYSRAVSANGQRSAIVNLANTDPADWPSDQKPVTVNPTDSVLYELHVRDFSMDENSGLDHKGKFKAFTESGKKTVNGEPSGIDYLQELGVTHVHLLPSYDFKTVNELTVDDENNKNPKFNWGYDPQNYNVPEGSYSTNPLDPVTRIKEFKEMVKSMHDHDMRVVMDVVYNHSFEVPNGPFEKIVPGYFYRTTDTGDLANGSGVGNEIATERPMVRKFIKDSVRYWAEEYNVDGFRFDLMGLIDITTMEQITKELHEEVDPSILIYGEPWQAGGSPLPESEQTLKGSQKDKNFAVFNDNLRGAIKGGSDDASKGFATGEPGKEADLVKGILGAITDFTNSPLETINYVTAHDNLNLWDKVIKTQGLEEEEGFIHIKDGVLQGEDAARYRSVEEAVEAATPHHAVDLDNVMANETVKRSLLSNGIVLTSQGIPFIHAGEEFLRTKYGDHNSYKSPDAVNQIRWNDKKDFKPVFDYYKGLIELRKTHPAFRMSSKEAIEKNIEIFKQDGNIVAYQLKNHANHDTWKNIVVIFNGNNESRSVNLPSSAKWNVVVNEQKAGVEKLTEVNGDHVTIAPLSMMVLYDVEEKYTPEIASIDVSPSSIALNPGDTRMIRGIIKDQKGNPILSEQINWSSSNDQVAKIGQNGKVTAISKGKAVITASAGSIHSTIEVTVDNLIPDSITLSGQDTVFEGLTVQLHPTVKDQYEQKMPAPEIIWNSSNKDVASVNSNGVVTGLKPGKTTITAKAGPAIAEKQVEVKKYVQRKVQITYVRDDQNYEDWNIWTWQTGAEDGEKRFTDITEQGAVTTFDIGPDASQIGFVIRKGSDWNSAIKDPYGEDRYIEVDPNESITKAVIKSGEKEFHTVPNVNGPVLQDGKVTFFYRNPELYERNEMDQVDKVQVKVNNQKYDMTYEPENEYFTFTLEDIEEGTHEYSFLVTTNGQTTEVTDPYNTNENGKSEFTYQIPDLDVTAQVYPTAISSNENAVITTSIFSKEPVSIKETYVDLKEIGGPDKVAIDPLLNKLSIAVEDDVTSGEKVLPVTIVDEFGNKHEHEAKVEVKPRQAVGELDFDWDEARIYFLLTDRFYDGDPSNNNPNGENYNTSHPETYHGGDIEGITEKLDYLDELGINTIWITPIVDNIDWDLRHDNEGHQYGYHGYWAKNFTKMDEHLGDQEDMKELISKAHDKGIKIMVDVVLNHTGYGLKVNDPSIGKGISNFPTDEDRKQFKGMLRDGGTDVVKGEVAGLPDLITEDPHVREQMIKWQTEWLEKVRTEDGETIDYFRVDTVKHVEETTWNAFKNELTEIKPDFKMIGENYGASYNNTGGYLDSGQMDSLLDFGFKSIAKDFIDGKIEAAESEMRSRNGFLSNTATMGQFLSSHDEDGFLLAHADGDVSKQMIAASLQITAKGQPVIYYGEELGESGKHAGDMDKGEFNENRYDMPWDKIKDNDLLEHYQTLLNIREDFSKVFSKGDRDTLAGGDEEGYSVFSRSYGDQTVTVGINMTDMKKNIDLTLPYDKGTKLVDLYSGKKYKVKKDSKIKIKLSERHEGGTFVLVRASDIEAPDPDEIPDKEKEMTPGPPKNNDGRKNDNQNDDNRKNDKVENDQSAKEQGTANEGESIEVNGFGLPITATQNYTYLLAGIVLLLFGRILYVKWKNSLKS
ncbi:type I pullulanase [Metabacillus arenae]|uniref:pullulanase n=1 Tax=Metabacillus arenae TaxID=2771434 RepID=A0A926RY52_9BACI|nr:type I pullulanase [Metabacillus arenae]MBD1381691.1 type I pullulanase [Metabacillus arenae]